VVTRLPRLGRSVLGVVLTLFTLWATTYVFRLLNDRFLHGGMSFDESYFVWGGWSLLKGLVPYRDFIEFKPPLVFLTHALALKMYGFDKFQYRYFFAYFPLGSLLALQLSLLSRGVDRWIALALIIACAYLWVNPTWHDVALSDSESIGLTYYLLGVACLLARTPGRTKLQYLAGVFFACTILSKEPFLPSVGMTWISGFLLSDEAGSLAQRAGRYAGRTLAGGLAVVVGLSVYMIPSGAMTAYLQMLHAYFRFYRDPVLSYCVVLGRFHPTVPLNDLHVEWRNARQTFLNVSTLGYFLPLGATSVVFIIRRSPLLMLSVLIAVAGGVWSVTASNCQWPHYYTMAMGGLFFALAVGLDSFTPYFAAASRDMRNFVRIALLGGVLAYSWVTLDAEKDLYGTRAFPTFNGYEPIPGILRTIEQNTTPSDYIVTTGQPSLYVQANRLNGIRESTTDNEGLGFFEGDTDEQKLSGVRAELLRTRPKLIILDPGISGERRKTRFRHALLDPFLAEFKYREISPMVWLRPD
jgi:hypothetical protein